MDLLSIFFLAIGLSMDTFAVSVSSGLVLPNIRFNKAIIIAIVLAVFQGLMPLLGFFAGMGMENFIKPVDHWIAFGLLALLGIRMVIESRKPETERRDFNPLKLTVMITMAIATSIDALVVGVSLAFVRVAEQEILRSILIPVVIIGCVTFVISMLGILFGKKVGNRFGKRMETIGGFILIFIGLRILVEHLWF